MEPNQAGDQATPSEDFGLENEEYVIPEQAVPTEETNAHPVVRVVAVLFLLVVLGGLGAYIFYGMQRTPAAQTEPTTAAPEVSEAESSDLSTEEQELINRMEAMQRDSEGALDRQFQLMQEMQRDVDSVDEDVIARMEAMNGIDRTVDTASSLEEASEILSN